MKIIPEKIRINSARMINGNINCPADFVVEPGTIEGYEFTFNVNRKVNIESNVILFLFKLKLDAVGKAETRLPISANYTLEYVTEVENLEEYLIKKEGEEMGVQNILWATLIGIIFSTTRGIIMGRTQGTILEGVILPVIDPNKLLGDGFTVGMNSMINK